LRQFVPAAKALRDITLVQLEAHRADLPAQTYLRCHHVISENERVMKTVQALQSGDMAIVGKCMAESHRSLKEDYEVSSVELDAMVSAAHALPGVIGARMTGGGFGGCTINLVRMDAVDNFKQAVGAVYRKATGIEPEIYVSTAGAGVTEITSNE
jgi:galactokinase